jgi:hypothetical protein
MLGPSSLYDVLTGGPIFVGSPKVKSAFAVPAPGTTAATNPAKTMTICEPFNHFIINLPFCPSGLIELEYLFSLRLFLVPLF